MRWLELSVRSPQEFVEPLSQIFYRYGHGGVVVESEGGFNPDEGESASPDSWVTLKTYLPVNSTARQSAKRGSIWACGSSPTYRRSHLFPRGRSTSRSGRTAGRSTSTFCASAAGWSSAQRGGSTTRPRRTSY